MAIGPPLKKKKNFVFTSAEHQMVSSVNKNMEYAIEYSMAYSKIFHKKKKKKSEISKFETSDLTTHMVLAKGKKKLPHSLSL